ncbi:MAG: penicillin-binding protein 2 [Thermomicrobiales bacterium]|nr:penicillin-binding protein 2 [Thermomicrobiales bacterium]MCO5220579.1 penicillin-binding protein 2 [Thermomicrobiales bacterium]
MRSDQIFLNRRVFVMKGAIVAGFAALATRLGYMQIVRGDYYQEETANTTQRWEPEKPVRGLIFDRQGRSLAENRRVWEVRVIPSALPKRDTPERERVRSTVISALRLPEVLVIDPSAVPVGSEETIHRRVANLLGLTKKDTIEEFLRIVDIRSQYNYLVEVDQFSDDQAPRFRAAAQELPGVRVINRFDYLVENTAVPDLPVVIKTDVSREIALTLEANRLYLPGIELNDTALVRRYPAGEVMSHVLGYVGPVIDEERQDPANQTPGGASYYEFDDTIGKLGLELWMEKVLRGSRGGRYVEVDGLGIESRVIYENPPVPGRNIKLTIDLELQAAATAALAEGLRFSNEDRYLKDQADPTKERHEYKAGAGAVVVLDVRNGDVLALASYPLYDNQLFVEGISTRKYLEYREDENRPLINKAAADHFPPGSTLKIFVAMAGLHEDLLSADTVYTCTSGIWVPYTWDESRGDRYLCWLRTGGGHGTLDLVGALEQSCDVYFYNVGTPEQKPEGAEMNLHYRDLFYETDQKGDLHFFEGLGIQKIHDNLFDRFWFGQPTGIELPFEAAGLVPDPDWKMEIYEEGWSAGDTINTSIGQGFFLSTPLQMAVNTASIANGGQIHRPRLLLETVDDTGKTVQRFATESLRQVKLQSDHLDVVRLGMWRVVNAETGTAHAALNPETGLLESKWLHVNPPGEEQIEIAGKTGTAEVGIKKEDGTYQDSHAWFTSYAPFDEPEIAVTVFLKEGGEGSSYAVPIADKVLRAYFELTGARKRGMILREDEIPIDNDHPAPSSGVVLAGTPAALDGEATGEDDANLEIEEGAGEDVGEE